MAQIVEFSEPGEADVLRIREAQIEAPGPGEVRIRVKAIGINRVELMWRRDKCTEAVQFPARLGYEAAGVVDALGPDVMQFAVGDTVSVIPAFSMNKYAMYGEVVLAPATAVIKHPPTLSFVDAASLWMMFITAYGALVEPALLKKGDAVLITAASSSVGLAAIQIANMLGATSIALTRTGAKRPRLLEAGAAHVIATEEQDTVQEVSHITGGQGARVAFDSVGGPTFANLIRSLTPFGTVFVYGMLSEEVTPLPMLEMVNRLPIIRGHTIWTTASDPARLKAATDFVLGGLAAGTLWPVIDRHFAFKDIVEAHRYMEANEHFGKIVVTV